MGGVPIIRGTILGVPVRRIRVFGGPCWGPPISGNYLMRAQPVCYQAALSRESAQPSYQNPKRLDCPTLHRDAGVGLGP